VTKQEDKPAKISTVKENFVEGILQNYLDQLLVTATSPQKIEKAILIPEFDETNGDETLHAESSHVDISHAEINQNEDRVSVEISEAPVDVEIAQVELISVDSVMPAEVIEEQAIASESNELALAVETESELASVLNKSLQPLTDQESWSSQGVECLVFSVGGLKLAVPLLFLGGVHEVDPSDVKPLIGQPVWYLGMVNRNEQNLQVIDTASFIMPERAQSLSEQGYKYLIQLEKTPWAIACHSIDDTVRLEATEIKWRGDRSKRVWLAGTVIEKMCALIDVSGLLQQVESSCKPV
jgi:purine-binding chemotaxis protein CheW